MPVSVTASFYFTYSGGKRQGLLVQFLKDVGLQFGKIGKIVNEACDVLGIEDSILWLVDDLTKSMDRYEGHVAYYRGKIIEDYVNETLKMNPELAKKFLERRVPLFISNIQSCQSFQIVSQRL